MPTPQSDAPGVATQVVDHTGEPVESSVTYTNIDRDAAMKAVINERLRRGFAIEVGTPKYDLPTPMNLGSPLIQNFDNIGDILELIENDPR